MDYDTIFDEPYEVEKPDPAVLQEMDKLAEPVFREWALRQIKRQNIYVRWVYPLLIGIALAEIAIALGLYLR